jgi:hypothetical protein
VNWWSGLQAIFKTVSEILSAGIAITAFALLLYALTFNQKDRIARSFTLILICVVTVFAADALGSTATKPGDIELWLRIQWIGILYLPPTYLQFSDAILSTTGKPSKGKRRWSIRITYLISSFFLITIPLNLFLGPLVINDEPAAFLQATLLTNMFSLYYGLSMVASWINFTRAYQRTTTPTTRRRMFYLITGALAPALGSFPYLLYGSSFASEHAFFFWIVVMISNTLVGGLIVMMSYSISFFGVNWPDRVVKRRLFKWIMRGPVTAIVALGITTIIRRGGSFFGIEYSALVPITMALSILMMEFVITLFSPVWEKYIFSTIDQEEVDLITDLSDRLMTRNDLKQFLEAVLAAVGDRFQSKSVFIAAFENNALTMVVSQGDTGFLEENHLEENILPVMANYGTRTDVFRWGNYLLMPLFERENEERVLLGILGIEQDPSIEFDTDEKQVLVLLSNRIVLALINRNLQTEVFKKAKELNPQFEQFQKMRAESRFPSVDELTETDFTVSDDLSNWVKDALTHFWGGPKLSESPLLELNIVKKALEENRQNPTNALRAVLKSAIDSVKPAGDRKFTGEWILYNILEMKFLQGKRVREVALKLAMSEADLYRKQRVAIETVASAIMEMENHVEADEAHNVQRILPD